MKVLPEITEAKISNKRGHFHTSNPGKGVSGDSQETGLGPGPSSASCSRENVTRGHPKRIPRAQSGLTARF